MPKTSQYRAVVGLSYPTDPKVIARLQKGEQIPWEERGMKRAEAGEVLDDIPSVSVPWLLDQGLIEEADRPGIPPVNAESIVQEEAADVEVG